MHTRSSLQSFLRCLRGGPAPSAGRHAAPPTSLVLPAGFGLRSLPRTSTTPARWRSDRKAPSSSGRSTPARCTRSSIGNGDHKADRVVVIASWPRSTQWRSHEERLAVCRDGTARLLRYDDIEKHLDTPPAPVTVRDDLPNPKAGHTWKFIAFGPDDLLYMTVGAPCNVCASPPMVVGHHPDEARWLRYGGVRRRRAQQRRVRLASGDARVVVHRQRPRHARRRRAG